MGDAQKTFDILSVTDAGHSEYYRVKSPLYRDLMLGESSTLQQLVDTMYS